MNRTLSEGMFGLGIFALVIAVAMKLAPGPVEAQTSAASAPIYCDQYAKDRSTTADVQLASPAGISSTAAVYVCGYSISGEATTPSDVNLRYSDTAGCTTNAVDLTPPVTVGAGTSGGQIAGKLVGFAIWAGLKTPSGKQLCVHRSAVQTSEVEIWFAVR